MTMTTYMYTTLELLFNITEDVESNDCSEHHCITQIN